MAPNGNVGPFDGTGTPGFTTNSVTDAASALVYNPLGITIDPATNDVYYTCTASTPNSGRIQMVRATDNIVIPLAGGLDCVHLACSHYLLFSLF